MRYMHWAHVLLNIANNTLSFAIPCVLFMFNIVNIVICGTFIEGKQDVEM